MTQVLESLMTKNSHQHLHWFNNTFGLKQSLRSSIAINAGKEGLQTPPSQAEGETTLVHTHSHAFFRSVAGSNSHNFQIRFS